tara:strand:- start:967 stop:1557 length:591 start_codon:yes stop_codon:yes gene_type:complete
MFKILPDLNIGGKMKKYILGILIVIFSNGNIFAQETSDDSSEPTSNFNSMFYVGVGSASGGENDNDDTPWSIGVLTDMGNDSIIGFDISGEGTMLDSTYGGYDDLAQGTSYNFLYGVDISENKNDKVHIGVVLGFVETEADCPDSYLGYQCYADEEPDYEHEFNGGGFLTYSFNQSLNIGLRATTNSTQLTIGFKF